MYSEIWWYGCIFSVNTEKAVRIFPFLTFREFVLSFRLRVLVKQIGLLDYLLLK